MGRKRTGAMVKCEICGKEFYKKRSQIERDEHHFCSNPCRYEGSKHERPAQRTGAVIACEVCGKEIYKPRIQLERYKHHFCSRRCAGKGREQQFEKRTYTCEYCRKPFQRLVNREKYGMPKYCSRECANKGRVGEGHPNWEGGRQKRYDGYVDVSWSLVPEELQCMCRKEGRVFEHRLIMAQHLGRPLKATEVVHHKNRVRDDNRLENLELYPNHTHTGVTAAEQKIAELEKQIAALQEQLSELRIQES